MRSWNRIRYTLWAPIYDAVAWPMRKVRRRTVGALDLVPGERLLVVGAGTGEDLPFVPEGVEVLAVDLTPAMLLRARAKARPGHTLRVMDASHLELPDESHDAVLLSLVVAVVDHPARCLSEAARVLRPGGRIAVLDKFVQEGGRPGLVRRILNVAARPLFSDINLRLGDVLAAAGAPLVVLGDEPAGFGGAYRIVRLAKVTNTRTPGPGRS